MRYKLVCFDMDGVIFRQENSWAKVHEVFSTTHLAKELEERYLKTNYPRLVDEVVKKLWKGKNAKSYFELLKTFKYNPGVKKTVMEIKKKGYKTAIISSAPLDLVRRAQKELGIDYIFGNHLVVKNDVITGDFIPAHDFHGKGNTLKSLCEKEKIPLKKVIAIGDGENDISMMGIVGKSIAFNSRSQKLKEICDVVIESNDLREVLKHIK